MDGWIKLHRKVLDNPIVTKDNDHLAVWIWLLLNASHREHPAVFNGEKITLKPGQLITGRKKLAEECRISESKANRIISEFKSEQQIEQQTNRHGSLISILRWDEYQKSEQQNGQLMNNQWTTSEQPVNTKQECKNDIREEYLSLKDEARDRVCNDEAKARLDAIRKTIRENRRTI